MRRLSPSGRGEGKDIFLIFDFDFLPMKKIFFIILFFVSLFSQAQVAFQKTMGTFSSYNDIPHEIIKTQDKNYVIVGESTFSSGWDIFLTKVDTLGNPLWTRFYGNSSAAENGFSCKETFDGGFIITGSVSPSFDRPFLMKTDSLGNVMWIKSYFDNGIGYSVIQTSDSGYVICGGRSPNGNSFVLKTDISGNLLWLKWFGYGGQGFDLLQDYDGDLVVTGTSSANATLMKLNQLGDTIWTRTFRATPSAYSSGNSIIQMPDSGYVIAGYTAVNNYDAFIVKTNKNGDTLWTGVYDFASTDYFNSIIRKTDGHFILTGQTYNGSNYLSEILFTEIDSIGNILWSNTIGSTGWYEEGNSLLLEYNSTSILAGWRSSSSSSAKIYLIKADSMGKVYCNENNIPLLKNSLPVIVGFGYPISTNVTPSSTNDSLSINNFSVMPNTLCYVGLYEIAYENEIIISPNPFSTSATFQIMNYDLRNTNCQFEMYDVYERVVKQFVIPNSSFVIERSGLPSGIYFYKLSNSKEIIGTGKIIIE